MDLLRAATLITPDPAKTAALYGEWLDYRVVDAGQVDTDLAASWGTPAMAGRDYRVLVPASGRPVFLRLIAGEAPPDYRALRTYGWAAIELCVTDTLAVDARLAKSPFDIIGPPKELDGLPTIFPMQIQGPDQEIIYLTQIRADMPDYDLPRAQSLIDRLFILVMACSDMRQSMDWFEKTLGITPGREMEIIYTMVSRAFDMPLETKHRLATGIHGRDCFLEFDQYPDAATPRPTPPGALPPGIAMASLLHPDIDAITAPWITPPRAREGALYAGRRTGTLRAPDGTLVEIIGL